MLASPHLLLLLVLRRRLDDGGDVLGEAELLQGLGDVVAGDGLLGLLLRDLVGLGRDERDELDAALDQQVAGLLGEGDAVGGREDLGDDLLDRRCLVSEQGTRSVLFFISCSDGLC